MRRKFSLSPVGGGQIIKKLPSQGGFDQYSVEVNDQEVLLRTISESVPEVELYRSTFWGLETSIWSGSTSLEAGSIPTDLKASMLLQESELFRSGIPNFGPKFLFSGTWDGWQIKGCVDDHNLPKQYEQRFRPAVIYESSNLVPLESLNYSSKRKKIPEVLPEIWRTLAQGEHGNLTTDNLFVSLDSNDMLLDSPSLYFASSVPDPLATTGSPFLNELVYFTTSRKNYPFLLPFDQAVRSKQRYSKTSTFVDHVKHIIPKSSYYYGFRLPFKAIKNGTFRNAPSFQDQFALGLIYFESVVGQDLFEDFVDKWIFPLWEGGRGEYNKKGSIYDKSTRFEAADIESYLNSQINSIPLLSERNLIDAMINLRIENPDHLKILVGEVLSDLCHSNEHLRNEIIYEVPIYVPKNGHRRDGSAKTEIENPHIRLADFDLVERIGQGGMAETWKAINVISGEQVCIKMLRDGTRSSALIQEYKALRKLDHPNIVKVISIGKSDGKDFIVEEYVEGQTLANYLMSHSKIPLELTINICRALIDAMNYFHLKDILHCDLKPSNILLRSNDGWYDVKIIDFGISIVDDLDDVGAITGAGRIIGTPWYMAPEQFYGEVLSMAADVYAFGGILYEMVTGERLFEGGMHEILRQKILDHDTIKIRLENMALSQKLNEIISQCINPKKEDRPSISALINMFAEFETIKKPCVLGPTNLKFEFEPESVLSVNALPAGWNNSIDFVANADPNFQVVSFNSSLRIVREPKTGFSSLMQRIPCASLHGQRMKISCEISSEELSDWAGMWLRIDSEDSVLYFNNMSGDPIKNTSNFKNYNISTIVPMNAKWINYGFLIQGSGSIDIKNFNFQVEESSENWIKFEI